MIQARRPHLSPHWRHIRHVAGLVASIVLIAATSAHAARTLWSVGSGRFSQLGRALSSAGDFNGDGYGDFLVGFPFHEFQPGPGTAILMLGAPQGADLGQRILEGQGTLGFGYAVAGGGDFDDDGFSDVVVSAYSGGASVFRGGNPPDITADLTLPVGGGGFGRVLASIGDWNADGFDDFAVAAPLDSTAGPASGRVFVYFGGATLDANADVVLNGAVAGDQFGTSVTGGTDLNGDGFTDLAVGSPYAGGAGAVQVFFGGPGFDSTPDRVITGASSGDRFGASITMLADFNADGAGDLAVGAPQTPGGGAIHVFYGGAGLDAVADWSVAATASQSGLGSTVAAGDDVNRDHVSDLLATDLRSVPLVWFGGPAADTNPDAPLSVPLTPFGDLRCIAGAGDVNGDGYAEWLYGIDSFGGMFTSDVVYLLTAHGDLQLIAPNGGDVQLLGGAEFLVTWAGPELANLEYARDGVTWQTLATGGGGAAANSATLTLPPGRADHTARMRVVAATDTVIDLGDGFFSVTDSIQTQCFGTTAMPGGTGVTWSAIWPGYPGATYSYRLYRQDGGGPETAVSTDPILAEGFFDPAGTPSSSYRLVAIRPDNIEAALDTVATGAFSCDSIQLSEPNGGESLFLANFLNVIWTGTRFVDVLLSRDNGATWTTVETGVPPPSTVLIGATPGTSQARVRVAVQGVGGAVWDDSDAPFSIHTSLQLQRFVAIALPTGGVALEWDSAPEPSLDTFLGYRLCRADTLPQLPCSSLGPWPNPGTSYTDPAGGVGSIYRLWATLFDYTEVALGEVTVTPGQPLAALGPSPARANEEVVLTMVSPQTANGSASDVEVRVYDATGRDVALLGSGLGAEGTITLRWTPAQFGMRSGVYWIRTRSASAGFEKSRRIVVL